MTNREWRNRHGLVWYVPRNRALRFVVVGPMALVMIPYSIFCEALKQSLDCAEALWHVITLSPYE